jgi:hypothetical protein
MDGSASHHRGSGQIQGQVYHFPPDFLNIDCGLPPKKTAENASIPSMEVPARLDERIAQPGIGLRQHPPGRRAIRHSRPDK